MFDLVNNRYTSLGQPSLFEDVLWPGTDSRLRALHNSGVCLTATEDDPIQHWFALTQEANLRSQAKDVQGAIAHYECARVVVQNSFAAWPDVPAGLIALVVSHLNLAQAQGEAGLLVSAQQSFCALYKSLIRMIESANTSDALRHIATQELGNVLLALQLFQDQHGLEDALWHLLQQAFPSADALPALCASSPAFECASSLH